MEFNCDAVLIDLDGVLVNSTAIVERHWKRWAESRGIPFARVMAVAHGRTSVATVRLVAPHLDACKEAESREAEEGRDTDGLQVYPSARELLHSRPRNSWAIVTSGNRVTASVRLQFADLPVPGVLVTANDVTHGKPDPEPYLLGASRLSVRADKCVVIEDAASGIEAARAANMRTVAVATTHRPELLQQADAIVQDLTGITIHCENKSLRITLKTI
jgi:sugar-phosphatase